MRRLGGFALLAILFASTLLAAQGLGVTATPWTAVGPAPLIDLTSGLYGAVSGRVNAVAVADDGSGTVYIATVGGIWASGDAGATWTALTDVLPQDDFNAVAADPANAQIVYAGAGDPNDPSGIVPGDGVYLSSDGGQRWSLPTNRLAGLAIARLWVDPANALHLLVAAVAPAGSSPTIQPGLFESSDGGQTWTLSLPGQVWDFAVDMTTGVVVAAAPDQLWSSNDGGTSFVPLPLQLPPGIERMAVAVNPAQAEGLLLLATDALGNTHLMASSDDGASWVGLPLPPSFQPTPQALAIAAGPDGTIWIGGNDLWASGDGGQTWTNLSLSSAGGPIPAGEEALLQTGTALWVANNHGLWRIESDGSIQDMNAGLETSQVSALVATPSGLVAGIAGEGVAAASGAGWWVTLVGGDASLAESGLDVAAVLPHFSALEESSDAGQNWDVIDPSAPSPVGAGSEAAALPPLVAAPGESGTLWAAANEVWESQDSGATWAALAGSEISNPITALAVAPGSPATIAAGSARGVVLISPDGGNTWTAVTPSSTSGPVASVQIDPGVPRRLWVAAGAQILSSADGGAHWTDITGAVAGTPTSLLLDPLSANILYAATNAGVFATADNGASWWQLGANLPGAAVNALQIGGAGQRQLFAAPSGRGIWSYPLASAAVALSATGGQDQSGPVGQTLPHPLVASAATDFGAPAAGIAVNWSDSASTSLSSQLTAADGTTQIAYTLPDKAGSVTVSAAAGASIASWHLTALPAAPARVSSYAGTGQSATVSKPLAQPLEALVEDGFANPVPGVEVQFSDAGAGGSFSTGSVVTDADGVASANYTMPPTPGPIAISASVSGLPAPANFSLTALPLPNFTLSLSPATVQTEGNASIAFTVQSTPIGDSTNPISLSCQTPVTGCSGFSPNPVSPGQTATFTLATSALAAGEANSVVVAGNDGVNTHQGTATVDLAGFAVAASPAALAIDAGQTAAVNLAVTPLYGYAGPVQLQLTFGGGGAPTGMTATLAQSGVSLDGTDAASDQLTLNTTTRGLSSPIAWNRDLVRRFPLLGGSIAIFLLWACDRRRCRRHSRGGWAAPALLALLLGGCGGGGNPGAFNNPPPNNPNGTPAGIYTVTLTASGNSVVSQTAITVTVN